MEESEIIGITREIDELGRVVLPWEYRQTLNMEPKDKVKASLKGDGIFITKIRLQCCLCHKTYELIKFKGKIVCKNCSVEMYKSLE